jgi:two-component system CheB/CheR fusion protein
MSAVMPGPKRRRNGARAGADQNPQIETILERIRDARNFDFRNYKRPTLHRRIERRMSDNRCRTLADYIALLDKSPAEYDALIGTMLIKVTSFFRDEETWKVLAEKILPRLLSEKRPGEEIRVWCAGCATGEEAFSVAILLAEAMGPAFHTGDVKIFGTDVDEKAIATARRAVYPGTALESAPAKLRGRYFEQEHGGWSVRKEIRRAVVFGVNNLVSDAPISRIDLLICRNVFIYLDAELQKRVLTRFHYALRRHGVILLGKSELIPFAARLFEPVDLSRRIYRKNGRRDALAGQDRLLGMLEQETVSRGSEETRAEMAATEEFHRGVLQSLRMPVIATDMDGTVLSWNPAAAAIWGRSEAEVAGKKLTALALPGLSGDLLIEKTVAVRDGRSKLEISPGVFTRPNGKGPTQLSVEVAALRNAGREITGLLYTVHDVTEVRELDAELSKATSERQIAYEQLQTINEEMQSSNEELETTNEELQTTNEELQSTNEELGTTNEELQSTNAELDATNREVATRTEEMNRLAFLQRAIIRNLSAAVVVLDVKGHIRLWNLAAERLLGVTEDEATGNVFWTLLVPALNRAVLTRLKKAMGQNQPLRAEQIDYELPTGSLGHARLTAVPIAEGGEALGSVILFEDTTRLSKVSAELAELKSGKGRAGRK